MNTNQLRAKLIKDAEWIVKRYIKTAKDRNTENAPQARRDQKEIWEAIIPMLQSAGDVQKIKAGNTKDVLKLLAQGKVTMTEAKELMLMMATEFEVTQLPALLEKFEEIQSK